MDVPVTTISFDSVDAAVDAACAAAIEGVMAAANASHDTFNAR
jgi:hypothetical protein